jgi:hypothetical protein
MDSSFARAVGAKDARRIILLCVAAATLSASIGYCLNGWVAKPQSFDQWWMAHVKICPECSGGPDIGMCEEAFEKLQESLRNEHH